MFKIALFVRQFVTFIRELLTQPMDQFDRWTRFVVFQLRLWRHCGRLLKQNRMGTQAAALSYHTIFGLVPLAVVLLLVFQASPAYRKVGLELRDFLYKTAELDRIEYPVELPDGSQEMIKLTDHIDRITDGFIKQIDTGTVTLFSAVFVIWAALGLLGTIERSFNQIWHVPRSRNFVHRIVNYWALLTLGPLLLGLGFYVSTTYMTRNPLHAGLTRYGGVLLPYLFSLVGLFFLYFVMPNTRVSVRAALWGAAVASLIWSMAKSLFFMYLTRFIPYKALYGVMGLVPLAVVWIYITWLIVLFGLQLTYATQHLKTLDAAELARMNKPDDFFIADDIAVIRAAAFIVGQFQARRGPVPTEAVAGRLDIPLEVAERILDYLVGRGLLLRASEPRVGYVPATEGGRIRLSEIAEAVAEAAFGQNAPRDERMEGLVRARQDLLAGHTLAEFATEPGPAEVESNPPTDAT